MIAIFTTYTYAQNYADKVHTHLSVNPKYIAERWANVVELESFYYVPIFDGLLPLTEHETITTIPHIQEEL